MERIVAANLFLHLHHIEVPLSSGKAEMPVYKVGECIQELVKLWKEYELRQTETNGGSSKQGPTLEIRIPAEHVTATNRRV